MIERNHKELPIVRQCDLLPVSRSSYYHTPKGESAANLNLMAEIDRQFLDTPFYGVQQMTWRLRAKGDKRVCTPSLVDAMPKTGSVDGSTSTITGDLTPPMAGERRFWYTGIACRAGDRAYARTSGRQAWRHETNQWRNRLEDPDCSLNCR